MLCFGIWPFQTQSSRRQPWALPQTWAVPFQICAFLGLGRHLLAKPLQTGVCRLPSSRRRNPFQRICARNGPRGLKIAQNLRNLACCTPGPQKNESPCLTLRQHFLLIHHLPTLPCNRMCAPQPVAGRAPTPNTHASNAPCISLDVTNAKIVHLNEHVAVLLEKCLCAYCRLRTSWTH